MRPNNPPYSYSTLANPISGGLYGEKTSGYPENPPTTSKLLQEDGFFILQADGSKILLEN